MIKRVEIVSLIPSMDPKTLQQMPGLLLSYRVDGRVEVMELDGSQKQVMDMFKIENLTDVQGKKFDMEMEMRDGKQKLVNILMVDDRQISYSDFEALRRDVQSIQNLLLGISATRAPQNTAMSAQ